MEDGVLAGFEVGLEIAEAHLPGYGVEFRFRFFAWSAR